MFFNAAMRAAISTGRTVSVREDAIASTHDFMSGKIDVGVHR